MTRSSDLLNSMPSGRVPLDSAQGGVSERLRGHVGSMVRASRPRGFESHRLRSIPPLTWGYNKKTPTWSQAGVFLFLTVMSGIRPLGAGMVAQAPSGRSCPRTGSNRRHPGCKPSALPLSYRGILTPYSVRPCAVKRRPPDPESRSAGSSRTDPHRPASSRSTRRLPR